MSGTVTPLDALVVCIECGRYVESLEIIEILNAYGYENKRPGRRIRGLVCRTCQASLASMLSDHSPYLRDYVPSDEIPLDDQGVILDTTTKAHDYESPSKPHKTLELQDYYEACMKQVGIMQTFTANDLRSLEMALKHAKGDYTHDEYMSLVAWAKATRLRNMMLSRILDGTYAITLERWKE